MKKEFVIKSLILLILITVVFLNLHITIYAMDKAEETQITSIRYSIDSKWIDFDEMNSLNGRSGTMLPKIRDEFISGLKEIDFIPIKPKTTNEDDCVAKLEFFTETSRHSTLLIFNDYVVWSKDQSFYECDVEKLKFLVQKAILKHFDLTAINSTDRQIDTTIRIDTSVLEFSTRNTEYKEDVARYCWHCFTSLTFSFVEKPEITDYDQFDRFEIIKLKTDVGDHMYLNKEYIEFNRMYFKLNDEQEYIELYEALDRAEFIEGDIDFEPSSWAETYVQKAIENNFLHKINMVNYQKPIDRSEFCNIVFNSLNILPSENSVFSDTNNPKISALYEQGIINGMGDGAFQPYEFLTREQAAVIFTNLAKHLYKAGGDVVKTYSDEAEISPWAKEYVDFVTSAGIMTGNTDGTFNPKGKITKQECITVLVNCLCQS